MGELLTSALAWAYRVVIVKFVTFTAIYWSLALTWGALLLLIGYCGCVSTTALDTALASIPSGVWWLLNLFKIGLALKFIFCAFATRFLIRRLPVIG